jgi:hypothetical protein
MAMQCWFNQYWQLGLIGLVGWGGASISTSCVTAQIVPDTSLETESSNVSPDVVIKGLPGVVA